MNLLRHVCGSTLRHSLTSSASGLRPHLLQLHCDASSPRPFSSKLHKDQRPPATGNAFSKRSRSAAASPSTAAESSPSSRVVQRESERLFVIAQSDPDRFGSQHTPGSAVRSHEPTDDRRPTDGDAGDRAEEAHLSTPPGPSQRLSTKAYADLIKEHVRNKRIKEALDVLEVRMLREDRVKPENYIYNLLIGECGRLGYTKKAFGLFTRMKQRGLKVTGGTYTALFNACANTPWPQDGLHKAEHLRQVMLEKGYEPNASNYNAMIKAYGRGGDLVSAFRLIDEMQTKRLPVDVQTLNFALQACASDTQMGFRHALLVWHKMLRRRMRPDVYSFNLMLRCVRDCGIGDLQTMQELIEQILVESSRAEGVDVPRLEANVEDSVLQIEAAGQVDAHEVDSAHIQLAPKAPKTSDVQAPNDEAFNRPNLLSSRPHLGRLVALAEVRKAEDRLLLLGGCSGFLHEMQAAKARPDIKTYTQLIDVLPPTNVAEKQLLAQLKRDKLKVDIDFFNVLIKKRSMRYDYDAAKEVLDLIRIADLQPDIVTYGVLALSCRTPDEADELMQEMLLRGVRINIQILGAMLHQGCAKHNFQYVLKIMQIVLSERIRPNEPFLMHLVKFRTNCYEFRASEQPYARTHKFRAEFKHFCGELERWREQMGLHDITLKEQIAAVREHPWEQFKYDQPEGREELKNPKLRHKTKLARHIQRIRPERMRDDDGVDVKRLE